MSSIIKGSEWVSRETGEIITVTHHSALSVGWREPSRINTRHTCHSYFLEIFKPKKADNPLLNFVTSVIVGLGGIGSFHKILAACIKRRKSMTDSKLKLLLTALVANGTVYSLADKNIYLLAGDE